MEAALDRGDVRAAGHAERQLQRVLVRLGAAVDEEHAREGSCENCTSCLGRAHADLHGHGVRLEVARLRLLRERTRPARMPVAERGDRVARRTGRARARRGCSCSQTPSAETTSIGILREHRREVVVAACRRDCAGGGWCHGSSRSGPTRRRER